jgi:CspA family cold shock protein
MRYGTIKSISERGFGFIGQEGGPDVYFHATTVGPEVFERMRVEQPVKFELVKLTDAEREARREMAVKPGPRAALVELIDRMPGGVLGRNPQELAPRHHPRSRQRKATWKRRIDVSAKQGAGGSSPPV